MLSFFFVYSLFKVFVRTFFSLVSQQPNYNNQKEMQSCVKFPFTSTEKTKATNFQTGSLWHWPAHVCICISLQMAQEAKYRHKGMSSIYAARLAFSV